MNSALQTGCILVGVFYLIGGCTVYDTVAHKTKDITRTFKAADKDLNKKVVVKFVRKTTVVDTDRHIHFQRNFMERIDSNCPTIHIDDPKNNGLSVLPLHDDGDIDNLKLALIGRQLGLNAIAVVTWAGFTDDEKETGFWFLKDTEYYIRTQMKVEVYDTETGSKILDEIFKRETEVDAYDVKLLETQKKVDIFMLEDTLDEIAATMAEKICDALLVQPWKGYIVSGNGDRVIISAGQDSGLTPGKRLEVFDGNVLLEGVGGHRFYLPGKKIGEVQITAVSQNHSEAEILSGNHLPEMSVVKDPD